MALSRKLRRRLTVSILAENESILARRERTDIDMGRSLPISARVDAFMPVPSWVCSVAKRSCMREMTENPVWIGYIDLLTIIQGSPQVEANRASSSSLTTDTMRALAA
ncbi:hypothetical protein FF80_02457 [Devosia sp. LC5]|nr:hypothetical protein FF80_02457 [Devosia sp. LC5]